MNAPTLAWTPKAVEDLSPEPRFEDLSPEPPEDLARREKIVTLLTDRQFKPQSEPPPLRPVFTLEGTIVATPGNLVAITSASKTGKSGVIGAMAASPLPHSPDADFLGFKSSNPDKRALLWFDSEQSPDDFWHCVHRALRRAGLPNPPPWFLAFCLTGLGWADGWQCVHEAIRTGQETHGGVHSILLDGVADFVPDVNDPAQCNGFVAELHDLAIRHDCPIVGVIHFNPGTEKTRGHLGSQLERKAETNLRLDKIDGCTSIWSDKQRRAPIPKGTGPCFAWSDTDGMHVSVASRQSIADAEERERLQLVADDLFCERASMHYSDLIATAKKRLAVSDRTAARRISELSRLRIIQKSVAGLWTKDS